MILKLKAIALLLFLVIGFGYSQSDFVRPSISVVEVVYPKQKPILQHFHINVPRQFDVNKIPTQVIKLTSKDIFYEDEETGIYDYEKINLEAYKSRNIGGEIVLSVLPLENGEFSNEILKKRGVYSATDYQVGALGGTLNKGFVNLADNFGDLGIKQLDAVYVVLVQITDFEEVDYQNDDGKRTIGYEGKVNYSIVKVRNILEAVYEFSDSPEAIKSTSWGGDIILQQNNVSVRKIGYIGSSSWETLFNGITTDTTEKIFDIALREVEVFQPKAAIVSKTGARIYANLGKKENLQIDNRFFVYEKNQKIDKENQSKIVLKKKGQVRVKKIIDNRKIATGKIQPSEFYKIAGGKMGEGMLMIQKEDIGLGFYLGYGNMNSFRVDYRLKGITPGLKMFFSTMNLAYIKDIRLNKTKVEELFGASEGGTHLQPSFKTFNFDLGFEWGYIVNSRIEMLPFVAIGFSYMNPKGNFFESSDGKKVYSFSTDTRNTNDDITKDLYTSIFSNLGARIKLNISGNLSLIGSAGYVFPILSIYEDMVYNIRTDDFFDSKRYFVGGLTKQESTITSDNGVKTFYEDLIDENPGRLSDFVWDLGIRYEF